MRYHVLEWGAAAPEGLGEHKYDETAASMIALPATAAGSLGTAGKTASQEAKSDRVFGQRLKQRSSRSLL